MKRLPLMHTLSIFVNTFQITYSAVVLHVLLFYHRFNHYVKKEWLVIYLFIYCICRKFMWDQGWGQYISLNQAAYCNFLKFLIIL